MLKCFKSLKVVILISSVISFFMFYEFELHEYITFCCLFILLNKKGYFFGILLILAYIVQIALIWNLKSHLKELKENIKADKTCSTFKIFYFEKEIKFC